MKFILNIIMSELNESINRSCTWTSTTVTQFWSQLSIYQI